MKTNLIICLSRYFLVAINFQKKMTGISLSNSFTTQSKLTVTTNNFSHRLSLADDFYRFIFGNYILIRMELKALKKALNTC